jgi:polyketide biosynthesis enoyl-CoA hydratase PksI
VDTVNASGLVRVTSPEPGVAVVTLNDGPGRNALSREMVSTLEATFDGIGRDERMRVVVLAGLPDIFCSGASRALLDDVVARRVASADILLPRVLLDCPLPCIAAMAGHAVGGGFALGVAADVVLLARESRYALNFLNMGLSPGMGTTRLLEHVLSPAVAHELLYTGEARRGRDFEGRTGVNHVLPRDEVVPRALDIAARVADKPRLALTALKRVLSLPRRQAFEGGRTLETLMHELTFAQRDVPGWIAENFADGDQPKPTGEPE